MKFLAIFLYVCIALVKCEVPPKRPLIFTKWPPTNHNKPPPPRGLIIQIRSGPNARISSGAIPFYPKMRPISLGSRIRPYKLQPHFQQQKHLPIFYKRPIQQNKPIIHHKNEYTFENPFNKPNVHQPIENSIHLSSPGPIHTIPAPNLSSNGYNYNFVSDLSFQQDNHLGDSIKPLFPSRPNTVQQYQVIEEQTNDQTLHNPFTGQQKLYAPDPDPSLPAARIRIANDVFSSPSNGKPLPFDVLQSGIQGSSSVASYNLPQFGQSVPQQQLPDTYGLPLTNQPQLQQHFLQQASINSGLPISYNPTYLVTQSNNLFNQHQQQQQLFKPQPNHYPGYNQQVASDGQLYTATQNDLGQLQDDFALQSSASQNVPSIAQLIEQPQKKSFTSQLTENEVQSLLNFGRIATEEQNQLQQQQQQLVVTNGYQSGGQSNLFDLSQRQIENDKILAQANNDLFQQSLYEEGSQQFVTNQQIQQDKSAHHQHQLLLNQQLNGDPMRIYVPDEYQQQQQPNDQNSQLFQVRSDDFSVDDSSVEQSSESLDNFSDSTEGMKNSLKDDEIKDDKILF